MAGKLVNVAITKAERTKRSEPSSLATEGSSYPYGLSITLDNDTLKKLGVDLDDYTVEQALTLVAKVKVTSIRSESSSSYESAAVGLQITALCLEADGDASAAAKALYKE